MFKIAIIGSGQLGSRHLQGIKTANLELLIEVVDPNCESLNIAEKRYIEIEENQYSKNIRFLSSINELSNELDLVIIATGSAPRFAITDELIRKKNVKNIIFEKVLFQNAEYFYAAQNLLSKKNIKAYVNCPRRTYDFYQDIRDELTHENKIIFNISGGEWGLGCNSIHFIDIIAYLTHQTQYTLNTNGLNKKIYSSKRLGYAEFCGMISGYTKRGDIFNLISQENFSSSPLISIVSPNKKYIIDEVNGIMISFNNKNWETRKIQVPFQSQLTGKIIENILLNKDVKLTTYEESMVLHLPLISALLDFYNSISGSNAKNCPIT